MTAQLVAPEQQDRLQAVPASTDNAAFEALYTEHFDRLRRFVLGLTGQAAFAEDVAQETLLRAYVRMETMDFDRPLWPWLKCVAVRLVVDNSRARKRESLDPDPAVETPTDTFDVTVERQLLREALRCLPARQRTALGLRYLENWKSAEVASALGLSRVAAEQLLLRARRRLSAEYQALGGEALGWRVALWPLLFVVSRLRDRTSKVRQLFNGGAAQVSLTVEGATNMVAVVAMGSMFLAGGVALAAPLPTRAPDQVRIVHATAFHNADLRPVTVHVLASVPAQPRVAPARRNVTVDARPAEAVSAETPQAHTRVTKVDVAAAAPIERGPADPVASAAKSRSEDKLTVRIAIDEGTDDQLDPNGTTTNVNCSGGVVTGTACAMVDDVDAAIADAGDPTR